MESVAPYAATVQRERAEARRLARKAREAVIERDRAIVRMSDAGFGIRDIAAETEIPQATVARILQRQRAGNAET